MDRLIQLLWIALGSALGGTLRFVLDQLVPVMGGFPVATFAVNLSGSLLIGYLAGLWTRGKAAAPHPYKWHFWITGICGGYTTFSAFSWQVLELINLGEAQVAAVYAAGSIISGLCAVAIGLSLARMGIKEKSHES
ncbi:MAG: CrcB family protein [Verrucomicrobiota bacterium]